MSMKPLHHIATSKKLKKKNNKNSSLLYTVHDTILFSLPFSWRTILRAARTKFWNETDWLHFAQINWFLWFVDYFVAWLSIIIRSAARIIHSPHRIDHNYHLFTWFPFVFYWFGYTKRGGWRPMPTDNELKDWLYVIAVEFVYKKISPPQKVQHSIIVNLLDSKHIFITTHFVSWKRNFANDCKSIYFKKRDNY